MKLFVKLISFCLFVLMGYHYLYAQGPGVFNNLVPYGAAVYHVDDARPAMQGGELKQAIPQHLKNKTKFNITEDEEDDEEPASLPKYFRGQAYVAALHQRPPLTGAFCLQAGAGLFNEAYTFLPSARYILYRALRI